MSRPISASPLAEIVPTWAISSFEVTFFEFLLEVLDDGVDREINTALEIHRIHAGGHGLGPFLDDCRGRAQLRSSCRHRPGTRSCDATSFTICAPIFSNLSSSSISLATVTPSLVIARPEGLVEHDIASLGAERHPHRIGENIDAAQHLFARLDREFDLLGTHCVLLKQFVAVFHTPVGSWSQSLDLDWFHSSTERVSNSRSGQATFVRSSASTSAPMISLSFMIGYLRPSILNLRARPAHLGDALLGICLGRARWPRRQLKHCCRLTLAQERQQHGPPIWKFERIVMCGRLVLVDLSKDCRPVADVSSSSIPVGQSAST